MMVKTHYSVSELDALSRKATTFLDSLELTPIAAVTVATGLLLSVIRAAAVDKGRLPWELVSVAPDLEAILSNAVPVLTAERPN